MVFAKQYEVWEARNGKPCRVKCEAAIGMKRVRINGVWLERGGGGIFDTEADCQEWIDTQNRVRPTSPNVDQMFVPVMRID